MMPTLNGKGVEVSQEFKEDITVETIRHMVPLLIKRVAEENYPIKLSCKKSLSPLFNLPF
jgi:hypothetical protein